MNKHRLIIMCFFLTLTSFPIWASSEIPDFITNEAPEAPSAPIDNYLIVSMLICFVLVGCYFYKCNKTYLNNER